MSRRVHVLMSGVLFATAISVAPVASGAAQSRTPSRSVHRTAVSPGSEPAILPGFQRDSEIITALVLLEGASVAEKVAAAADAGVSTSASGKRAARQQVAATQGPVAAAVQKTGVTVLMTLKDAVNALVVRGTRASIRELRSISGVLAVQPSRRAERANWVSNEFTGVHRAWEDLGITGVGQRIAIIDDGIDYTHADFGGSGDPDDYDSNDRTVVEGGTFPTTKVIAGYDFVGDAYDASSDDPSLTVPMPDSDPLACGEHGTHVAGTAAGYGVSTDGSTYAGPYTAAATSGLKVAPGAAPLASLMAYKIFGCDGSVDDAIIVAAIDRAVVDGATVINMSLGADYGTAESIESRAIDNAVRAGVVVVVSAGNAGGNPYLVGGPSTANRALSVAALDAVETYPGASMTFAATTLDGQNSNRSVALPLTADTVVLDDGDGGIGIGCDPADYAGTSGKIVVVMRGTCGRVEKLGYGADAGAVAVVMVNNASGLPPIEGVQQGIAIPFIGLDGDDADAVMAADGLSTTLVGGSDIVNPGYADVADFSSGGPRSGDSGVKPDIIAPGVGVPSALVGSGTDSVELGGTSMAAPHVSGIAALIRSAHPSWSAVQVKAALMSSSTVDDLAGFDPRRMGAGRVSARDAVAATAVATTSNGSGSLSFNFQSSSERIDETREFTIENLSNASIRYGLALQSSSGMLGANVTITPSSVTVPPKARRTVRVRIRLSTEALAALPGTSFWEIGPTELTTVRGVVVATASTPTANLRVPFMLVPKGESKISLENLHGSVPVPRMSRRSFVTVRNTGAHGGSADVYAWQLSDREDHGEHGADLVAGGVQTLWLDAGVAPAGAGDPLLVFAVQHGEGRSTAAVNEDDVLIDTDLDGEPDFLLIGIDLGWFLDGSPDGYWGAALLDLESGELIAVYDGDAPFNGSVVELPVFASDLGLSAGTSVFNWTVESYDYLEGGYDSFGGWATWDAIDPPLETGQWSYLDPGASEVFDLSPAVLRRGKHDRRHRSAVALGYMVVAVDNEAGTSQVRLLSMAR